MRAGLRILPDGSGDRITAVQSWEAEATVSLVGGVGMEILKRFFRPKKTANLIVYVLMEEKDGNLFTRPFGKAPRFDRSYEETIKIKHNPHNEAFIGEDIDGISIILHWKNDGIDAISFLSLEQAEHFPGYSALRADVLKDLDPYLRHFPRL